MASITNRMAIAEAKMSWLRPDTFPEITDDERRPTNISSQYMAATAPATAVAFSVMPETVLSER